MLQAVLSKKALEPAKRRALAAEPHEQYGVSQRRLAKTLRFNRSSLEYRPRRNVMNEILLRRIKDLAAACVRYGYRRIHVLLGATDGT